MVFRSDKSINVKYSKKLEEIQQDFYDQRRLIQ